MSIFLAFVFLYVIFFYRIGQMWGGHKERIRERDRTMARGMAYYNHYGQYYVGDRKAYRIIRNGRDVLVDAYDTSKVLYDITTHEEARIRTAYLEREQKAIDKAKAEGYDWFYIPSCERGTNEAWMRKEIATGRLFKTNEYSRGTHTLEFYKLLNPVGTGRMNYVRDESVPSEKLTEEEYLWRFYHIDYQEREKRNQEATKEFFREVMNKSFKGIKF